MSSETANRVELILSNPLATRDAVKALCAAGRDYRAISVPSSCLLLVEHFLGEGKTKICCRIGFPDGSSEPDAKRYETELAIDAGAQEIQVVPSLAKIADGDYKAVLRELRDIAEAADERPIKVACEPRLWNDAALQEIVQVILDSGTHYLCTSEDPHVDTLEEVRKLRALVGRELGIIASVASLKCAEELTAAGANLLALKQAPGSTGQIPSPIFTGAA
jgi:deoxyribose-phosphate aldolase